MLDRDVTMRLIKEVEQMLGIILRGMNMDPDYDPVEDIELAISKLQKARDRLAPNRN